MSAHLLGLLAEASLRSLLVAVIVAVALRILRVRAGAVLHGAWTAVLVAMLAMPLLPPLVPDLEVAMPRAARLAVNWITLAIDDAMTPTVAAAAQPAPAEAGVPARTAGERWPDGGAATANGASPRRVVATAVAPRWPAVLAVVYLLGVAGLAIGAARGWSRASRLRKRARLVPDWEIALAPAGLVAESAEVRVPLTIGTLAPRIILPAGWRQWPTGTLTAVIAHERAHADRRDLLVSLAARLNVCLFWFHPLSWWLERRIASTAEQAADDDALRAGRHGADYARVLLDMADAVRRAGGRVAWPGLGMGAARLDHRIARVLDRASRRSTRFQRGLVAGACGLAVAVGSACSLADDTLPDSLTPRDIVVTPGSRSASLRIRSEAMNMSEAGARALQEQWRRQPADLVAAETLLAYYQPLHNSFFVAGAPDWIERRREVDLWVIEHRPASPLAIQANLAFSNRGFARLADPEGVARAAALWRARIDDADADARALKNAAMFFVQIQDDPRAAERALLRGRTLDPRLDGRTVGGVRYDAWTANIPGLGALYADVLTRRPDASESERRSRGDADEAFAREIRATLEATTDAALLAETGRALIRYQRWPPPLPVDPVALGRSYLQRAIALDPAIARAHRAQRSLDESGNTGG